MINNRNCLELLWIYILIGLIASLMVLRADAAKVSLKDYIEMVQEKNLGVKSAQQKALGQKLRGREGSLLYAPQLNSDLSRSLDKRATTIPSFNGTSTEAIAYDLYVSEQTPWGLKGQLGYSVTHILVANATGLDPNNYYLLSPSAQLTLSLLRNGLGSETQAQEELKSAANRAGSYGASFDERNQLFAAEQTYWRLASARELVRVQTEILARAQKLFDWAERRMKLQLGEKSDSLQAKAAVDLREIELASAKEEERSAALAFNQSLGQEGSQVADFIDLPGTDFLLGLQLPEKAAERLDVAVARETETLTMKTAQLAKEQVKPTLEAFANYSRNGKDRDYSSSYGESWSSKYPVTVVGLRFSVPLNLGLMNDVYKGALKEQDAASMAFEKKRADAEVEWQDLDSHFRDVKTRLRLVTQVEKTQKEKMDNERERLLKGRTTTYQTINFEQDYAQAVTLRIKTQNELLRIYAQSKLFGDQPWSN